MINRTSQRPNLCSRCLGLFKVQNNLVLSHDIFLGSRMSAFEKADFALKRGWKCGRVWLGYSSPKKASNLACGSGHLDFTTLYAGLGREGTA